MPAVCEHLKVLASIAWIATASGASERKAWWSQEFVPLYPGTDPKREKAIQRSYKPPGHRRLLPIRLVQILRRKDGR